MGFILCIIYISYIWKKNFGDEYFGEKIAIAANYFTGVLPTDKKFLSLKFSAFRHAMVFLVSASLIYFINIEWLNSILLWLNFVYAALAVWRQTTRKKDMKKIWTLRDYSGEYQDVMKWQKQTLKATGSVAVYSVYLVILLYCVYGVRP